MASSCCWRGNETVRYGASSFHGRSCSKYGLPSKPYLVYCNELQEGHAVYGQEKRALFFLQLLAVKLSPSVE
jgi:hypothetical protein